MKGQLNFAFAIAKEAINDPVLSLTKINDFSRNCEIYWKIADPSSMLTGITGKCVILTLLVKCAQNDHKMTHITVT